MRKQKQASTGQPTCPHCGGWHWGQRFDDCPYVRLLADPSATDEQRANAREILAIGGTHGE